MYIHIYIYILSHFGSRDLGSSLLVQHSSIPRPCTAHLLAMAAVEAKDWFLSLECATRSLFLRSLASSMGTFMVWLVCSILTYTCSEWGLRLGAETYWWRWCQCLLAVA